MAKFPGSNHDPVVFRSPVVLGPMPPPCNTPWRRRLCGACRRLGCLCRVPRGDLVATAPFCGAIAIVVLRDAATFGHQDRCEGPSSAVSSQRRHRSHTTAPIWRLTAFLRLHVTAFVTFVNNANCKFCVAVSRPSRQSLIRLRLSLPRGKMVIDAPTDRRDGTNPLDNAGGESKRERVEEMGGTVLQQ